MLIEVGAGWYTSRMHMISKVTALVSALVLLTAACNKEEKKDGSATASSSAAKAEAGPVTYKTGIPAYAGPYDGKKALMGKNSEGTWIFLTAGCPSFSCADMKYGNSLDKEKLKAACPTGQTMSILVKALPSAGGKTPIDTILHTTLSDLGGNGIMIEGAEANELEVVSAGDPLVARVHLKGDESVEGVVSAKSCPAK